MITLLQPGFISPLLTLSGNEITDAVRAANVEGDGLPVGSGLGIWRPTTNYVLNSGAETGITNTSNTGTATASQDATRAKFGGASLRSERTGGAEGFGRFFQTPTGTAEPSQVWSVSGWFYHEDVNPINVAVGAGFRGAGAGANLGDDNEAFSAITSGVWAYRAHTVTAVADTDRVWMRARRQGDVGSVFWLDGSQSELQPISTPVVFTDGTPATRAAARVQHPASLVDETQGSIALRYAPGYATTQLTTGRAVLWQWRDDADNLLELRYDHANNRFSFRRLAGAAGSEVTVAKTFALNEAIDVVAHWTATTISLSVNGAAFVIAANTNIPTLSATEVDIGSAAGAASWADGNAVSLILDPTEIVLNLATQVSVSGSKQIQDSASAHLLSAEVAFGVTGRLGSSSLEASVSIEDGGVSSHSGVGAVDMQVELEAIGKAVSLPQTITLQGRQSGTIALEGKF